VACWFRSVERENRKVRSGSSLTLQAAAAQLTAEQMERATFGHLEAGAFAKLTLERLGSGTRSEVEHPLELVAMC
jgi:hypothetical protein